MKRKTCRKCGVSKQIRFFAKNKSMKDGRLNICNRCRNKNLLKSRPWDVPGWNPITNSVIK